MKKIKSYTRIKEDYASGSFLPIHTISEPEKNTKTKVILEKTNASAAWKNSPTIPVDKCITNPCVNRHHHQDAGYFWTSPRRHPRVCHPSQVLCTHHTEPHFGGTCSTYYWIFLPTGLTQKFYSQPWRRTGRAPLVPLQWQWWNNCGGCWSRLCSHRFRHSSNRWRIWDPLQDHTKTISGRDLSFKGREVCPFWP